MPRVQAQRIIHDRRVHGDLSPTTVKELVFAATGNADQADKEAANYILKLAKKNDATQ